jgi:hypothetical protein
MPTYEVARLIEYASRMDSLPNSALGNPSQGPRPPLAPLTVGHLPDPAAPAPQALHGASSNEPPPANPGEVKDGEQRRMYHPALHYLYHGPPLIAKGAYGWQDSDDDKRR